MFGAHLFRIMGADDVILPMVTAYMNVWFIGLPLFALPMVAMSMLRALGNARVPGGLMTAGAVVQVLLAPALIFGLPGLLRRYRLHGFCMGVRRCRDSSRCSPPPTCCHGAA